MSWSEERLHLRQVNNSLKIPCVYNNVSDHLQELMSCHSQSHVHLHAVSPLVRGTAGLSLSRLPCGGWGVDNDTVWNDIHTPSAAKVAAGSVTELVNKGETSCSGFRLLALLRAEC